MIDGFCHLLAVLWDVEPEEIRVERGIKDVNNTSVATDSTTYGSLCSVKDEGKG